MNRIKKILQNRQVCFALSALLIIVLSFILAWLPWLGYGEYNHSGLRSTRIFAYLLAALGFFSLAVPGVFSRTVYWLVVVASLLITGVGWLYFDFYRSYLDVGALRLLSETASDAGKVLTSLESLPLLLSGLLPLSLLALLVALPRVNYGKVHKAIATCLVLLCFYAAFGQFRERSERGSVVERYVYSGNQAVLYFLASAVLPNNTEVTQAHLDAFRYFDIPVKNQQFPLLKSVKSTRERNHKNVIFIILESVRSVETAISEPEYSYTPSLDKIAARHSVARNHYANSTQTVRAELSILCGLLDNSGAAPVSNAAVGLKGGDCLPEILRGLGYQTLWFHGNSADFFSRRTFHPSIGFADLYDRDRILLESGEDGDLIGWGLSDEQVFRFTFDKLEQLHGEGQRFFAEVMTLSNHYPFDWSWPEDIASLSFDDVDSGELYRRYLKGITYTDRELGRFWQRFMDSKMKDDTIVMIMADHGLWLFNEAQQERSPESLHPKGIYFRSPLVVYSPDEELPDIDKETSQVDIPATLLDLLGISGEFAFLGQSMFGESAGFVIANQFGMPSVIVNLGSGTYGCTLDDVNLAAYGSQAGGVAANKEEFSCFEDGPVSRLTPVEEKATVDEIILHATELINYFDVGHVLGFSNTTVD